MFTEEEKIRQLMEDAGFTEEQIRIFINCIFDDDDD